MATWMMMNFQDFNCFSMLMMMNFYDFMMILLFVILLLIFYMIIWFKTNNFINLKILHNQLIEIIWTLIPIFILLFIAIPSLKILYFVEEILTPSLTVKILGHQWYWSYEYNDFKNLMFDSFMVSENNFLNFRLLDVDNRLILPFGVDIRGLVSSIDVIHSWAMPSLGIKVDASPGRLNQFSLNMLRPGVYFGQCSEICGLNHSFMPIVIESITLKDFFYWINKNL